MKPEQFIETLKNIKYFNSQKDIMFYCLDSSNNDGLNLEFGVFEGNTINLSSERCKDKMFYGFDSFEGLPEDWRSGFSKGAFNLDGNMPKVNKNVTLIKGLFSDTLNNFLSNKQDKVSFIHIDCDLYSSTKFVLENLKNRFCVNTIILFDEFYNYPGWENGEFKAWQELIKENENIKFEYIGFNIKQEQVALRITNV